MKHFCSTLLFSTGIASAAAVSHDTTGFATEANTESATLDGFALAENPNRTLVMAVAGERLDAIASLQFGGTDMVLAAVNHTGQTHASVYYVDIPDSGGSILGTTPSRGLVQTMHPRQPRPIGAQGRQSQKSNSLAVNLRLEEAYEFLSNPASDRELSPSFNSEAPRER